MLCVESEVYGTETLYRPLEDIVTCIGRKYEDASKINRIRKDHASIWDPLTTNLSAQINLKDGVSLCVPEGADDLQRR